MSIQERKLAAKLNYELCIIIEQVKSNGLAITDEWGEDFDLDSLVIYAPITVDEAEPKYSWFENCSVEFKRFLTIKKLSDTVEAIHSRELLEIQYLNKGVVNPDNVVEGIYAVYDVSDTESKMLGTEMLFVEALEVAYEYVSQIQGMTVADSLLEHLLSNKESFHARVDGTGITISLC